MDHSLYSYLDRMTTQTLQTVLQTYSQDHMLQDYYYAMSLIIDILTKRGAEIPQEILCRLETFVSRNEESETSQSAPTV